jgi:molecular chaperone GrpE
MVFPRNGRTIKIPVKKVALGLPAAEAASRPLLTGSTHPDPLGTLPAPREETGNAEAVTGVSVEVAAGIEAERAAIESVRQRLQRQAEAQVQQERRRLLTRLLAVADNLERALAHADGNDPLRAGVALTLKDLRGQLAQEGVAPIHALGATFDPHLHEAVTTDGSGGDAVVEVLQTGYTLDGQLLRPARVVVGRRLTVPLAPG